MYHLFTFLLLVATMLPNIASAQFGGAENRPGFNEYINRNPNVGVNRSSGGIDFLPADKLSSITNVQRIIETISNYLLAILIAISVFFILWAAWLYLSSGGEEKATGAAKGYLIYAAIAIAVALFARALPDLVNSIFNS